MSRCGLLCVLLFRFMLEFRKSDIFRKRKMREFFVVKRGKNKRQMHRICLLFLVGHQGLEPQTDRL